MAPTESERRLVATIAAHQSWANTEDRAARTANARAALHQKFLDAAGGDPVKAEHLKKAHFARLALKSAQSRRKARELTAAAAAAEAELADAVAIVDEAPPLTQAQRETLTAIIHGGGAR